VCAKLQIIVHRFPSGRWKWLLSKPVLTDLPEPSK